MNLNDLSTDERARGLVALASRWNELVGALTGLPGFADEMIAATLNATFGSLAHPLLAPDHRDDLIVALRDATSARETYGVYGFLPDHLDERFGDHNYSAETVEQALDDDVNAALFPLLTAQVMPCFECKRTAWDVTYWRPARPGSTRCADHALVAVHDGFGVGLVAS